MDFNDLHFECKILSEDTTDTIPSTSIVIPGLQIIGSRWDEECQSLADLHPTSQTINRYGRMGRFEMTSLSANPFQLASSHDDTVHLSTR